MTRLSFLFLLHLCRIHDGNSFGVNTLSSRHFLTANKLNNLNMAVDNNKYDSTSQTPLRPDTNKDIAAEAPRRKFLIQSLAVVVAGTSQALSASATEMAIGGAEKKCREKGNCLETFDLDGAVGWTWGGKDRCDATDPRCGPNGQLLDAPPSGASVPDKNDLRITHVVDIDFSIGKSGERGRLKMGLYGNECPVLVSQFIEFCAGDGIVSTSKLMMEDGLGVITGPVSMATGGVLNVVYPGERLDFGVPSQAYAFARAAGKSKAGDNYVPQPRPTKNSNAIESESSVRKHDCAGLVSVPAKGMGYGSSGPEDEAFASSFQVTASAVPGMDRDGRKVIGQVLDSTSMDVLERLASIPTKKGMKGVIPGQNSGPPLIKVAVTNTSAQLIPIENK